MEQKFLAVLTRCRDEFYIKEWVDYYLSQGVDSVYIIDDDSEDKSIYDFIQCVGYDNVHVSYQQRYHANTTTEEQCVLDKDSPSNKLFRSRIKDNYEWLIYCDVDEFIVTKKHFDLTLKERLQTINEDIVRIFVPWVLMSGAKLQANPDSVLKEVVYRHDHDKKHPHKIQKFRCRYDGIEVKTIARVKTIGFLHDHAPEPSMQEASVDGVTLRYPSRVEEGRFMNLRNDDIAHGEFLCYHYRYISDEHATYKLRTSGWYINDGYTFEDLKSSSYPEVYDDTLLRKVSND